MKIRTILILTILSATAHAAPSGEQGPISDLAMPALNFGLLAILLFVFLRKPIKEMFKTNAQEVESLYKHAEEKDKEAQLRYAQFEKKMNNLDSETKKVLEQAELEAQKVQNELQKETEAKLVKLKEDAEKKVEYEKNILLSELNKSLLDEVIQKAKAHVKSDKELQAKATRKLSEEVQS